MVMKIELDIEAANAATRDGSLGQKIEAILSEQKPEAVYFIAANGNRTGLVVVNMKDESEIPFYAEPWFLAFDANIEFYPAMIPADLMKAGPAIEKAAKQFG
jgi:hypothetical protein